MDNKKSIELIILEVLGCLDSEERNNLQLLKETDENFPWKIHAEFQNLSALLPSVQITHELPSVAVKERMVNKLNHAASSENSYDQSAKFVPAIENKNDSNEDFEEILIKNKIDWGSLSVSKQSTKPVTGYEEVKPKTSAVNRESKHIEAADELTEDEKFIAVTDTGSNEEEEINIASSSKLKKYVMVSIILFLISLTLFGYLFIFRQTDSSQTLAEKKPDEKVVSTPVEEFVYNNIQDLETTQPTAEVQQGIVDNGTENKSDVKVENNETSSSNRNKSVLPKAPPNLPEPIEAPLIETTQISSAEETNRKEEMNVPPPKEVIEENEEPTYFVAVEEMPEPIGGLAAIQQKIVYPELARRAGVQGKVYIRAFVDENGNVTNAEIVKGIGGGCDEAALDAILQTKFTPGKQRGKPIKVQITVPVVFKL